MFCLFRWVFFFFIFSQDLVAVSGTEVQGGQRLISCGLDRAVHVWDIAQGTYVQVHSENDWKLQQLI